MRTKTWMHFVSPTPLSSQVTSPPSWPGLTTATKSLSLQSGTGFPPGASRPGCPLLWLLPGLGLPSWPRTWQAGQNQKYLFFNLLETLHLHTPCGPQHSWEVISSHHNCANLGPPARATRGEGRSSGAQPQCGSAGQWAYLYLSHSVIHSAPTIQLALSFVHTCILHALTQATSCPFLLTF